MSRKVCGGPASHLAGFALTGPIGSRVSLFLILAGEAIPREAVGYEGRAVRVWIVAPARLVALRQVTRGIVKGNLVRRRDWVGECH